MIPMPMIQIAARLQVVSLLGAFPPIIVDNSDGSGLRIEWQVDKVSGPTIDQARVTVYNLGRPFRKMLAGAMAIPGFMEASLSIGWAGVPELLFSGDVWKMAPEKKTGTDVLTVIDAGAGAGIAEVPPAGGGAAGIAIALIVAEVLAKTGLNFPPTVQAVIEQHAAAVPMAQLQNYTADRGTTELLDACLASIGLSWGVDRGDFVVFAGGLRMDILPSILTPQTGLLSWEELDDGGVEFDGLAQPRVCPGAQVQMLDMLGVPIGGGPLRIDKIQFSGASEGPSTMSGTARKALAL